MDEELKYYRVKLNLNDVEFFICGFPHQIESYRKSHMNYEITECEKPTNAEIEITECEKPTNAEIYIPPMHHDAMKCWAGENCKRCANRFNTESDFCLKHHKDKTCYRFKLDC